MSRDYEDAEPVGRAAIDGFLRGRLGAARVQMLESRDVLTISATREDDGWRFFVGVNPPSSEPVPSNPIFLSSLFLPDDADTPTIDRINPALPQPPIDGRGEEPDFTALLNSLADAQNNLEKSTSEFGVGLQDSELGVDRAAEILNVSRSYLIDLLEEGEIRFHRDGSHRRIRLEDLLEYKRRKREESRKRMEALAREDEKLDAEY